MEAVIQHFRGALNGFNRQDVQDYIEKLAASHRQELAELQKRLDKEEGRAAQLEEELAALRGVEEEASKNKTALDSSAKMVTRLKGELSQSESKLSVAKKELERLQAQVAVLSPQAASYQELRDRAASVELEAHQRAQETVNTARLEADRVRGEAQGWLSKVLEQYDQLRKDLNGLLELARAVSGGAERLELLDESARRLREQGGLK